MSEVKTNFTRETNLSVRYMMKNPLGQHERRQLVADCNWPGLVLFEYMLRMAAADRSDLEITDASAAKYFGVDEQVMKRARLRLQKKGWFHKKQGKSSDGSVKFVSYYLGKEEVANATSGEP